MPYFRYLRSESCRRQVRTVSTALVLAARAPRRISARDIGLAESWADAVLAVRPA